MVEAAFLYPPYPHARIRSIDTAEALSHPGVLGVITNADVPDICYGGFVKDRTLFARNVVRFEGEVIAAVAGTTKDAAKRACALIHVDYDPLEPVLDPDQALGPDSPLVHSEWESYTASPGLCRSGNDCAYMTSVKGDVDAGFGEADYVVEGTYTTDMSHSVPIEPHTIVAQWNGDRVTIWSSTQVPFMARAGVAEVLGLQQSQIRIIVPYLGGGFGGKCDFHFEAHIAALARKVKRPVRLVFDRREEFVAIDKTRHPFRIWLKTGVTKDGTITARRARLVLDKGAYVGDGVYATECGLMMVAGPYRIPNLLGEAHTVYTTRTPGGSVRAPGGPQVCWAVEQHTDALAARVGLDPVEFRRRNLVAEGDTGQTGQVFGPVSAIDCLERAASRIGWGRKSLAENEGVGVACGWWFSAPLPSGAYVKLNADGSGSIITGAQENGSGAVMGLPLLAAEELGMRPEQFSILYQDTDAGPWDLGSAGSQTTINNGRAVVLAAREVREQLLQLASDKLEVSPTDLELVAGEVRAIGAPTRAVSIAELAATAHAGQLLLGRGSGQPPSRPAHDVSGCAGRQFYSVFASPTFFCHVAKVRVDRDTGVVEVLRYVAAHDYGRILNPIGAEGQVEGGVVHGLGIALSEGTVYLDGQQQNPGLLDYKLQTCADAPEIEIEFVETDGSEAGPYGAKAVGEPPVIGPAAAVANAITAAIGRAVTELPMTPPRVWAVLTNTDDSSDG
jgi:CO/xanthine dehydrogenase Mo-binding subunit